MSVKADGNCWQRAVRGTINDPVLTPMLTAANQLEGLTAQGMKRVRDAHRETGRANTSCS